MNLLFFAFFLLFLAIKKFDEAARRRSNFCLAASLIRHFYFGIQLAQNDGIGGEAIFYPLLRRLAASPTPASPLRRFAPRRLAASPPRKDSTLPFLMESYLRNE